MRNHRMILVVLAVFGVVLWGEAIAQSGVPLQAVEVNTLTLDDPGMGDGPTPFPRPEPPKPKPIEPGFEFQGPTTLSQGITLSAMYGTLITYGPDGWGFKQCLGMAMFNLDGAPAARKEQVQVLMEHESIALTNAVAPFRDAFLKGLEDGTITGTVDEINARLRAAYMENQDATLARFLNPEAQVTIQAAKATDCNRCDGCRTSVCCPTDKVSTCEKFKPGMTDCIKERDNCNATYPKPKSSVPTVDTRF